MPVIISITTFLQLKYQLYSQFHILFVNTPEYLSDHFCTWYIIGLYQLVKLIKI